MKIPLSFVGGICQDAAVAVAEAQARGLYVHFADMADIMVEPGTKSARSAPYAWALNRNGPLLPGPHIMNKTVWDGVRWRTFIVTAASGATPPQLWELEIESGPAGLMSSSPISARAVKRMDAEVVVEMKSGQPLELATYAGHIFIVNGGVKYQSTFGFHTCDRCTMWIPPGQSRAEGLPWEETPDDVAPALQGWPVQGYEDETTTWADMNRFPNCACVGVAVDFMLAACIWGDGLSGLCTIRWSKRGTPYRFSSADAFQVAPDEGSRITKIIQFADMWIVFKEHSVFVLAGPVPPWGRGCYPLFKDHGCTNGASVQYFEGGLTYIDDYNQQRFWSGEGASQIISGRVSEYFDNRQLQFVLSGGSVVDLLDDEASSKGYTLKNVLFTPNKYRLALDWRETADELTISPDTTEYKDTNQGGTRFARKFGVNDMPKPGEADLRLETIHFKFRKPDGISEAWHIHWSLYDYESGDFEAGRLLASGTADASDLSDYPRFDLDVGVNLLHNVKWPPVLVFSTPAYVQPNVGLSGSYPVFYVDDDGLWDPVQTHVVSGDKVVPWNCDLVDLRVIYKRPHLRGYIKHDKWGTLVAPPYHRFPVEAPSLEAWGNVAFEFEHRTERPGDATISLYPYDENGDPLYQTEGVPRLRSGDRIPFSSAVKYITFKLWLESPKDLNPAVTGGITFSYVVTDVERTTGNTPVSIVVGNRYLLSSATKEGEDNDETMMLQPVEKGKPGVLGLQNPAAYFRLRQVRASQLAVYHLGTSDFLVWSDTETGYLMALAADAPIPSAERLDRSAPYATSHVLPLVETGEQNRGRLRALGIVGQAGVEQYVKLRVDTEEGEGNEVVFERTTQDPDNGSPVYFRLKPLLGRTATITITGAENRGFVISELMLVVDSEGGVPDE